MGCEPFAHKGEALGLSSLPVVSQLPCQGCSFWQVCVLASPTHFDVIFFLFATQPTFGGFFVVVFGGFF